MAKGLDKITLVNLYECDVRLTYEYGKQLKTVTGKYMYTFGEKPYLYLIINNKDIFISLDRIVQIVLLKIRPNAKKEITLDSNDYV